MDLTEAFDLGSPGDPPCLFLHGFTGSPAELRPLAKLVAARGFRVLGPRLPGHGLGAPDLATAGAADWVRTAVEALRSLGRPAHVLGLSMGGLLAVRVAADEAGAVRSLALLAPAVRLRGLGRVGAWTLWRMPWIHRRWPSVPWSTASDARDPALRAGSLKNPRLSLLGLAELRRLQATVLDDARRVHAPTLLVLGRYDRTVSNPAARRLGGLLSAEVMVAEQSGHQLGLDRDHEAIAEALLAHFARTKG